MIGLFAEGTHAAVCEDTSHVSHKTNVGKFNVITAVSLAIWLKTVIAGWLRSRIDLQIDLRAAVVAVDFHISSSTSCSTNQLQTTLHINNNSNPTSAQQCRLTMHRQRRTLLTSSCTEHSEKTEATTALGTTQWLTKSQNPTYLHSSMLLRCSCCS